MLQVPVRLMRWSSSHTHTHTSTHSNTYTQLHTNAQGSTCPGLSIRLQNFWKWSSQASRIFLWYVRLSMQVAKHELTCINIAHTLAHTLSQAQQTTQQTTYTHMCTHAHSLCLFNWAPDPSCLNCRLGWKEFMVSAKRSLRGLQDCLAQQVKEQVVGEIRPTLRPKAMPKDRPRAYLTSCTPNLKAQPLYVCSQNSLVSPSYKAVQRAWLFHRYVKKLCTCCVIYGARGLLTKLWQTMGGPFLNTHFLLA